MNCQVIEPDLQMFKIYVQQARVPVGYTIQFRVRQQTFWIAWGRWLEIMNWEGSGLSQYSDVCLGQVGGGGAERNTNDLRHDNPPPSRGPNSGPS
jgi:hypothetical protein